MDPPVLLVVLLRLCPPGLLELLSQVLQSYLEVSAFCLFSLYRFFGLLQPSDKTFVFAINVFKTSREFGCVMGEAFVVFLESVVSLLLGVALLGESHVYEIDLILEVLDVAFLLLDVVPQSSHAAFIAVLYVFEFLFQHVFRL